MKPFKILIPADFSESSDNAGNYGFLLANDINASVILFHVYHIQVPTAEMPIMVISPQQLEKDNLQRLDHYRNRLMERHINVTNVECRVSSGFAAEEIARFVAEEDIDLIVMGVSDSGKVIHALMGSVTTTVLSNVKIPVLVIPESAKYRKPEKMAFACDYETEITQKALLALKSFVDLFEAHLYLVDIRLSETVVAGINDGGGLLEDALHGISHSSYSPRSTDVIAGLMEFEKEHNVDLLIMIPRKHSLFSRIFYPSTTKDMVFKTTAPILALKE